jgi:hypothetical protein
MTKRKKRNVDAEYKNRNQNGRNERKGTIAVPIELGWWEEKTALAANPTHPHASYVSNAKKPPLSWTTMNIPWTDVLAAGQRDIIGRMHATTHTVRAPPTKDANKKKRMHSTPQPAPTAVDRYHSRSWKICSTNPDRKE